MEFLGVLVRAALLDTFWQQLNLACNVTFLFSLHSTDFVREIINFQFRYILALQIAYGTSRTEFCKEGETLSFFKDGK